LRKVPDFIGFASIPLTDNDRLTATSHMTVGLASDHGSDRKKRDYSNEKSEPNSCIKQDPGGYRREGQHDRRIEWNAEQAQPPQTRRHKRSQAWRQDRVR
jgi:hypothetical protein